MRGFVRALPLLVCAACGRLGFADMPATSAPPGVDAPTVNVPMQGLVAYWSFDQTGTTAYPDFIHNNTASCVTGSCPGSEPGVLGSAATFDGSTTCLTVGSLQSWSDPTFTISAWVKPAGPQGTLPGPIAVHESSSGCPDPELALTKAGGGFGLVQLNTSSAHNEAWTANTMTDSAFHHVAVSWDGTTQTVYVDGTCACDVVPALPPVANPQPFTIGCYPGAGSLLTGSIDELRVYDRTLSPDEVGQLYAQGGGSAAAIACPATCATTAP